MLESKLQENIIVYAKKHAMVAYKVVAVGVDGFPDLFLARDRWVELWETKHPGKTGRLRPAQVRRIRDLTEAGVVVRKIDSMDQAKHLIDRWGVL